MNNKPTSPFNGYDWSELCDYFNITVNGEATIEEDGTYISADSEEIPFYVNNTSFKIKTYDEQEILLFRLREYLFAQLDVSSGKFKNNTRSVLNQYLEKLIEQSGELDYNAPALKGILMIENDSTFLQWFVPFLPTMWT